MVEPACGQGSRFPGSRIAVSVRNVGDGRDDWLVSVIDRMVCRMARARRVRRFACVADRDADVRLELLYQRASAEIQIDAVYATNIVASAAASSIVRVVSALVDQIAQEICGTLPSLGPSPDERADMERLGAASFDLYQQYRAVLRDYYSSSLPDVTQLATVVRTIVAADPSWAHAYALMILLEGKTTANARRTVAAARETALATRDPSGSKLVDAFELISASNQEAAFELLMDLSQANPGDLIVGAELLIYAATLQRTDEARAMARQLHAAYPELVFGMDLADALRRSGRDHDAERVIRDSVAIAPENVAARVELVRIDARADRLAEARAHVRDLLLIHGERDEILPEIYEALVASDEVAAAHRIADRMLVGNPLTRARGRYRIAVAAVIEGRFAAAYDSIRRAIDEHRVFGLQSELVQCLELARAIAPLVADVEAQRRYTSELAEAFATLIGDMGTAAATRYELALIDRRRELPSIDEHLVGLVDGPVRDVARRRMLRAAAVADCGSAHKAVAAGFSAFEENTASLVAFALCACRVGEIELARRSLERAVGLWSSLLSNQNSPYHAVLARFHLAGVLFEMGERAASRAAYEAFLRCWSDPDRPIPEVGIARRMLEQIQ